MKFVKLIKNAQTGIGVSVFTLQRYFRRHPTVKHIHPKSKQSFIISRLAVVNLFPGGSTLAGSHGGLVLAASGWPQGCGTSWFTLHLAQALVDLPRDLRVLLPPTESAATGFLPVARTLLTIQVGNRMLVPCVHARQLRS